MGRVEVWLNHCTPQGLLGGLDIGFLTHQVGGLKKTHPDVALISSHSVSYINPGSSGANYICFGEIYGYENSSKMLKATRYH